MKKIILCLSILITVFFCTSCLTVMVNTKDGDIPFYGTIDTRFGYENYYWGMHYEDMENMKDFPLVTYRSNGEQYGCYGYYVKYSGKESLDHYGHGQVNKTDFYFKEGRLYSVHDELRPRNPSLESLHERYGDFSEVNVVKEFYAPKAAAVYTNSESVSTKNDYSLQIIYWNDGFVDVYMRAPYTYYSIKGTKYLYDKGTLPSNKWHLLGATNGEEKSCDLVFLNKNDDGDYIVIHYNKNHEEAFSSVLIGFHPAKGSVSGTYEIKTSTGLIEKKLDSSTIRIKPIDFSLSVTNNKLINTRDMLNLILENQNITIRKDNRVSVLQIAGFEQSLSDWGITLDELDFAIANEEF